jgi:hypothetical protein
MDYALVWHHVNIKSIKDFDDIKMHGATIKITGYVFA